MVYIGISSVKIGNNTFLNVHNETWNFHEDEPERVELINQVTGKPYYVVLKQGYKKIVEFSIGDYDDEQRALLQGDGTSPVYAKVSAVLKSGQIAEFPAVIVATRETQDTAVLLKVQCTEVDASNVNNLSISGNASVAVGATTTLTASGITSPTWTASNAHATVSSSGVVSGVTEGAVTITATGTEGSTSKIINVTPAVG